MKNSADQGGCYPQSHRRPRWITPSEICRILHILWKLNSIIIALLFTQNISLFLKEFRRFALCFSAHQNNTTLSTGFLGQRFNNLLRAALLTSLVQYLVNSSCLWWIMHAVLRNGEIFWMNNNYYYCYHYHYHDDDDNDDDDYYYRV